MAGRCDRCDSEAIFELSEGSLAGSEKAGMLEHIESCPECRESYERERLLSRSLGSCFSVSGISSSAASSRTSSVYRDVAMSLPTRSPKARIAWAVLALGLFVVAGFAMSVGGNSPVVAATDVVDGFWTTSSALTDTSLMFLGLIGPVILIALVVGAVFDLALAALVVAAIRYAPNGRAMRRTETRRA